MNVKNKYNFFYELLNKNFSMTTGKTKWSEL